MATTNIAIELRLNLCFKMTATDGTNKKFCSYH